MPIVKGIRPVEILEHLSDRLPLEIDPANTVTVKNVARNYTTNLQRADVIFGEESPDHKIAGLPAVTISPDGGEWQARQGCYDRLMFFQFDCYASGRSALDAIRNCYGLVDDIKAWLHANPESIRDGETIPRTSYWLIRNERPPEKRSEGSAKVVARISFQAETKWHEGYHKDTD